MKITSLVVSDVSTNASKKMFVSDTETTLTM